MPETNYINKVYHNNQEYTVGGVVVGGGSEGQEVVYLTQEEYDALPASKLTDGKIYKVKTSGVAPGGSTDASDVEYDNTTSGLTANNVQDAIDEVVSNVETSNEKRATENYARNGDSDADHVITATEKGTYKLFINFGSREDRDYVDVYKNETRVHHISSPSTGTTTWYTKIVVVLIENVNIGDEIKVTINQYSQGSDYTHLYSVAVL